MDFSPVIAAFLASERGREALAAARAVRQKDPLERASALAGRFKPEEVRAALAQDDLRARAAAKTRLSEVLLFTKESLEQATHEAVAAERAARFAAFATVADLGAGIGLDAIALARAGRRVVAVERDPVRATFLRHNFHAADLVGRVEVQDFLASPPAADAAFLDPDRRPGGRRFRDPERFEPPPDAWRALSERYGHLLVKLAPGTKPSAFPESHIEWVSFEGEMKEARIGFGSLAIRPERRALILPGGATVEGKSRPWPDPRPPAVGDVLLDPDPAVVIADLVGEAAVSADARPIHPRIAYLLGSSAVPWAAGFVIREVLAAAPRALQAWIDRNDVGDLTIRTRGVSDPPDAWRKRLKVAGTRAATLVVSRGPDDRYLGLSVEPIGASGLPSSPG